MVSLTAQVNACGPFIHEFYTVGDDEFNHEGPVGGRSAFLWRKAAAFIDETAQSRGCAREELSVLEVGASDGWLLNLLWHRYGMRDLTGLEPRGHSIARGRQARALLGIDDGVIHVAGDPGHWPEELADRTWDVVICFGVIHHLSDIQGFLNDIASRTRYGALFETLTLDDNLVTDDLTDALEPKDIIYGRGGVERQVSLCGVKLESNILWGSTVHTGIVMVPAVRGLTWMTESAGFEIVGVEDGFETQLHADHPLANSHRQHFHSSVITTRIPDQTAAVVDLDRQAREILLSQEIANCLKPLPKATLEQLSGIIESQNGAYAEALAGAVAEITEGLSADQADIVRALVHVPEVKLAFEWGKFHASTGDRNAAVRALHQIVDNPCDDWRSCYRSFYLLSLLESDAAAEWQRLCLFANPEFPLQELPGSYSEAFPA
ncbi:MAG: class I SAM-dependent methyltransferase [Mycobacterium sp.]